MPTFYQWLQDFSENGTPRGALARDLRRLARAFPWVEDIDSFADLVTLTSESFIHQRSELGGDLSDDGFSAADEGLWIEYCAFTGHRINGAITIDWTKLPWAKDRKSKKRAQTD